MADSMNKLNALYFYKANAGSRHICLVGIFVQAIRYNIVGGKYDSVGKHRVLLTIDEDIYTGYKI